MTALVEALHTLNLNGEIALAGRWITIQGEQCVVYVIEATWSDSYYTWCADPAARAVEVYRDPTDAILAGLRRAARPSLEQHDKGTPNED